MWPQNEKKNLLWLLCGDCGFYDSIYSADNESSIEQLTFDTSNERGNQLVCPPISYEVFWWFAVEVFINYIALCEACCLRTEQGSSANHLPPALQDTILYLQHTLSGSVPSLHVHKYQLSASISVYYSQPWTLINSKACSFHTGIHQLPDHP